MAGAKTDFPRPSQDVRSAMKSPIAGIVSGDSDRQQLDERMPVAILDGV
jgi:hypothetical protein